MIATVINVNSGNVWQFMGKSLHKLHHRVFTDNAVILIYYDMVSLGELKCEVKYLLLALEYI